MCTEGLDNAVFMVRDQSGNEYILPKTIPTAEIAEAQYGEKFKSALLGDGLGFSMTFSLRSPKSKGCIDHLFCRPTMAAYRYVRSERRKKEKERRRKLRMEVR